MTISATTSAAGVRGRRGGTHVGHVSEERSTCNNLSHVLGCEGLKAMAAEGTEDYKADVSTKSIPAFGQTMFLRILRRHAVKRK